MEVLLGAEVDLFTTTEGARSVLEKEGYANWGIYVIDNRTGHGMMSGIDLAQEIRQNSPGALVVSLNSSDMGEMKAFGLENLRAQGIEFWYKREESFLMIPWIADCVKEGKMIPKFTWLKRIGEEAFDYTGMGWEKTREIEKKLRLMCLGFRDNRDLGEEVDESKKGILMTREVGEYLQELKTRRRSIERD